MTDILVASRDFGEFHNYSPIPCQWIRSEPWVKWWPGRSWQVDIWEYNAHRVAHKMYYVLPHEFTLQSGYKLPAGTQIQPNHKFLTDFGSIPPFFNGLPSLTRTRFLGPYILHDAACRHGELFFKLPLLLMFQRVKVTRLDADQLLRLWVGSTPWCGNLTQRTMIYSGVRIGARFDSRTDSKPGLPPPAITPAGPADAGRTEEAKPA